MYVIIAVIICRELVKHGVSGVCLYICGQIVPDVGAERCRVVLDSCKLNKKYKIVVAALTQGNSTELFLFA